MRRIAAVLLAFMLVIFMSLTTFGMFGRAFSDGVRHFVRDW
jgi:Ni,Fe-hydrogenase I cytochrome b subunit